MAEFLHCHPLRVSVAGHMGTHIPLSAHHMKVKKQYFSRRVPVTIKYTLVPGTQKALYKVIIVAQSKVLISRVQLMKC